VPSDIYLAALAFSHSPRKGCLYSTENPDLTGFEPSSTLLNTLSSLGLVHPPTTSLLPVHFDDVVLAVRRAADLRLAASLGLPLQRLSNCPLKLDCKMLIFNRVLQSNPFFLFRDLFFLLMQCVGFPCLLYDPPFTREL